MISPARGLVGNRSLRFYGLSLRTLHRHRGLGLVLVGLLIWTGAFHWFGRLPGDLRFERGCSVVYVPLTSMVLLSIALSVLLAIVRRLL